MIRLPRSSLCRRSTFARFFFSSRRRHTIFDCDWSSDVCSSDLPKRSLVFMTVSGEERGLWGSAYFADHPTVPLADVIADLNIDMVGRNAKDTVAVIGREHSNLGVTLDSVAAAHRELNIKPVGDLWPQEGLFFRSDHYNFAKKGVPILFFTTGLHPDYHQVTDSPDKIDAEKEARFARLVFYLGLAVANTPQIGRA